MKIIFLFTILCLAITAQGLYLPTQIDDPMGGNWECLKKYIVELTEISTILNADLKECRLDPATQNVCTQTAVQKAVQATNEITAKCNDDSDPKTLSSRSGGNIIKECFQKYSSEFKIVKIVMEANLKACRSSTDKPACVQKVLAEAKASTMEIIENIKQCIQQEEPTDTTILARNQVDSVETDCLAKYAPEFAEVKSILGADLDACKSSENQRECAEIAVKKATDAAVVISEKIYQCIKDGSIVRTSEAFSVLDSERLTCVEKYKPEQDKVFEELNYEIKQVCKSADNKEDCIAEAVNKAQLATAAVNVKIRKCQSGEDEDAEIDVKEFLESILSIHRTCEDKYGYEFVEMRDILTIELKECNSSEDRRTCIQAAQTKAKTIIFELIGKVYECIIASNK